MLDLGLDARTMERRVAYCFAALLAIIAAVVPAAIWPDLAVPMEDNWNNWYSEPHPQARTHFTLQNPPRLLAAEITVYRYLVVPPGYLRRIFTGWPTAYAVPWVHPYKETAGLPPLAFALEHIRWALPLWFVLLVLSYEAPRAVRRNRQHAIV